MEPLFSLAFVRRVMDGTEMLEVNEVFAEHAREEGFYSEDLMRKAAKAQWYAKHEGLSYGKVLSFCPLNWTTTDDAAESTLQVALDSCFFPVYEVERGITNITYDPELLGRRRPVTDWLGRMGKTKHLVKEGNEDRLAAIEEEAMRRWRRIKAMHENPEL